MLIKNLPAILCLCLFPTLLQAQQGRTDYDARWKMVDSLVDKRGLMQSALTRVNKILGLAKAEKNPAQTIKALTYRQRIRKQIGEDSIQRDVSEMGIEITEAEEPLRSILKSMLADLYENYYERHQWELRDRTRTEHVKKGNIATWVAQDFTEKITELYLASISQRELLYDQSLMPYDPILIRGNLEPLRPTLFDLLAQKALSYFGAYSGRDDRQKPNGDLNDPFIFSKSGQFAEHALRNEDTSLPSFQAFRIFQVLIRMHSRDLTPDALIDVDIQRLEYANDHATMPDKDSLYLRALANITGKYGSNPVAAKAWYQQANLYATRGRNYDPLGDTTARYDLNRAIAICRQVADEKDSSMGRSDCRRLLFMLSQPSIDLRTEQVNIPGQPFRTLVSWKNIDKVYFRVIKQDHAALQRLGDAEDGPDGFWKRLLRQTVYKTFSQKLPETGDHQQHSAEIRVDALPAGEYALLAATDSTFSMDQHPMVIQYFHISSLAFIHDNEGIFVLDRESGHPIADARVSVWHRKEDRKGDRYVPGPVYHTDLHGRCVFNKKDRVDNGNDQLDISTTSDHLRLDNALGGHYYFDMIKETDTSIESTYDSIHSRTYLFTDRAIYRPGQTVWFKGIVVSFPVGSGKPIPRTSIKVKVVLHDAGSVAIDTLQLTTNEFGSYQGRFDLPTGRMNGEYYLEDLYTQGRTSFSVEEYKLPKFFVKYEPVKGNYRIGDSIHVKGGATSYAGNYIDGATVQYHITRQTNYPHLWRFTDYRVPGPDQLEIAHGETHTRPDGSFNIDFAAAADPRMRERLDPVFTYTVSADITDINGETRSGTTEINIGYRSLDLSLETPPWINMPTDSLFRFRANIRNLAGEDLPGIVHTTIYMLNPPDRLIRQRLWDEPDQFVMSRDQYLASFPHDEYAHESKPQSWERRKTVYEQNDSSGQPRSLTLLRGSYVIEATTTDASGKEVKDLHYFNIYDQGTGEPAFPAYQWSFVPLGKAKPGDLVHVQDGSSAKDVYRLTNIERQSGDSLSYSSFGQQTISTVVPVGERDRGGIGVLVCWVKDNRFYEVHHPIDVPWTDKELQIHYTHFKDKTLPGSQETWQMHISGEKQNGVAAEMLSGMYDASLDQFKPHGWEVPLLHPDNFGSGFWDDAGNFTTVSSDARFSDLELPEEPTFDYDEFISWNSMVETSKYTRPKVLRRGSWKNMIEENYSMAGKKIALSNGVAGFSRAMAVPDLQRDPDGSQPLMKDSSFIVTGEESGRKKKPDADAPIPIRRNLVETAFFLPNLHTDSAGDVSFSFTMPEALTTWKWMTLAHTKELAFGYAERSVVTQKSLMVQPNAPRFLREGDRMELSAKIVNLTDSEMTGQAALQLSDPTTDQTADGLFLNRQANQFFTVPAKQSVVVNWPIEIPFQYNRPLTYRITAGAGNYSDGEQAILPVVSNRMLVTESLPLNMPVKVGIRHFSFDKLLQSGSSETLSQHALTVEFTTNPTWYAVQALPYLMEFPYECAEQTFNRFYANALAAHIVQSSPRIRDIFEKWRTVDTAALLSNLEKNQELKSVLLEETPWVLEGKSESQQKKNIALLFDILRMNRELAAALDKLKDMQTEDGGFPWFKGGRQDRYITQYILTGIGRLMKLNALPQPLAQKLQPMIDAAIRYADDQVKSDYADLQQQLKRGPVTPYPDRELAQYLYMRSYFPARGLRGDVFPAVNAYRKRMQSSWLKGDRQVQGMIALALYRTGDLRTAQQIIASLRETGIRNEEFGMYWKSSSEDYYWYQAPIETQAVMIEAFREIAPDAGIDGALKTWLLKQKQTHNWSATKATADACYALLLGGTDWLSTDKPVTIRLGDKTVSSGTQDRPDDSSNPSASGSPATRHSSPEAGTGYIKQVFDGPFVNPQMGDITVKRADSSGAPAWGAVYWQYFENLDQISPPSGLAAALTIDKKLFIKKNTDKGAVLEPIEPNGTLHPGNQVVVRIVLRSDRDLEYVHMKDMRAACMEPVNVLSGYKWQGGLGYYENTKDASTDFFFDRLPRGVFVFEYSVFVGQTGNFSNGVTSIECMYAPEFAFHSEGIRVNVEPASP